MLIPEIEKNAGKIWKTLMENGKTNLSNLKCFTKLDDRMFNMSIGWLSREGKIQFKENGKHTIVGLTEEWSLTMRDPEDIKAGIMAPDFSLEDFKGHRFILSNYRGDRPVILIFIRGFSCRYSQWYLENLHKDYQKFKNFNAEVAIIGQHSKGEFANIWRTNSFPFVGLPDEREKVARLYNQKVVYEKLGRLSAIFIANLFGFVVFSHYSSDIQDFPENKILFQVMEDKCFFSGSRFKPECFSLPLI